MSNSRFTNPLRHKLKRDEPTYGLWVTLADATVTEIAADAGADWAVVDMEHGALDYRDLLDHLRAANGSEMAVLARLPLCSVDTVKRALDLGAHGIIVPMIRTARDVEQAFDYARYPPLGQRGLGGERATRWGAALERYVEVADQETLVIPMIETAEAVDNIETIFSLRGLEAFFVGTADLSQSRGHRGQWEGPGVAEDVQRVVAVARSRGIAGGVIARNKVEADARKSQGFRMIALGTDTGLISRGLREQLAGVKASAS
jgi:2-keto-3-deoxy-L-rhamnonate aldolase RhmA